MAHVSARTPIFPRGSAVLDYWLVHAEGLTVQPLGARVEKVVVAAPVGRAEALIVRSRMTRRRKAIPAGSIAAVEPSAGELLLEVGTETSPRWRRQPDRRPVSAHAAEAVRRSRAASIAALSWLRPRVSQAASGATRQTQLAAAHTARGAAWLAPRLGAHARTAGVAAARLTLAAAVLVARGSAQLARVLQRASASAAERARIEMAARRELRRHEPEE